MPYASIDCLVRISRPFCAELPYRPVIWVFGVEEGDEAVERVTVGSLWVCLAWARADGKRSVVSLRVAPRAASRGSVHKCRSIEAGNSRYNDIVSHVAEVQSRLSVFGSGTCDDLSQQGSHIL